MKKNLFLIATLTVATIGVYIFMSTANKDNTLRVAFPSARNSLDYEPTQISFDYEYIFLENIYSSLLEVSKDGSIEAGIAEKVDWVGDDLKLVIRSNLKTALGQPITADDVLFSLKRLLILSGNTHGNFKDIVCPNTTIKSIEENCEGLRAENNSIFINAKGRKTFLMPMLAAIDFAIIPKNSVDPKTLKITNMKETSGPFYVDSDDSKGNIILKANPYHYRLDSSTANKVILVPTDRKNTEHGLSLFRNNQVDHITTIDPISAHKIIDYAESDSNTNLHITAKIKSLVLFFTQEGEKKFSKEERQFIGEKTRAAFRKIYEKTKGFEPSLEFFPHLSEGGLAEEQIRQLKSLSTLQIEELKRPIKFGIMKTGALEDWSLEIQKSLPTAECFIQKNMPNFMKNLKAEDTPDVVIIFTDTGFAEDISLISYSLNAGFLGLSKSKQAEWLADYMSNDDKKTRIEKLKALHFRALSEAVTIPLMASSYAAMTRKPWKIELSELFANNQLWRIKHQ